MDIARVHRTHRDEALGREALEDRLRHPQRETDRVGDVALLHRLVLVNLRKDIELVVFGDGGGLLLGHG